MAYTTYTIKIRTLSHETLLRDIFEELERRRARFLSVHFRRRLIDTPGLIYMFIVQIAIDKIFWTWRGVPSRFPAIAFY